jgi:hypothetical protein
VVLRRSFWVVFAPFACFSHKSAILISAMFLAVFAFFGEQFQTPHFAPCRSGSKHVIFGWIQTVLWVPHGCTIFIYRTFLPIFRPLARAVADSALCSLSHWFWFFCLDLYHFTCFLALHQTFALLFCMLFLVHFFGFLFPS